MKMIKCDKCGTINDTGDKFIIFKNSTAYSDCQYEGDLCATCKEQLYEFLEDKSLSVVAKEKAY